MCMRVMTLIKQVENTIFQHINTPIICFVKPEKKKKKQHFSLNSHDKYFVHICTHARTFYMNAHI